MTKLLGIVTCGGKSTRMGTDKGLISINKTCWAKHAANKFYAVGLDAMISINSTQTEKYRAFFTDSQMVIDSVDIGGPLAGLLSVHLKHPEKDLVVLACDMIDMQVETISHLVAIHTNEPSFDFYVYQNEGYAEAFCAIYTAKALKNLLINFDIGKLSNMSMKSLFDMGSTKRCKVSESLSFNNYNTLTKKFDL